jgi:SAM-dependent MidA family methyltransferase
VDPVRWREAWHEALYAAERGFYVARGGPSAHFTTATHAPTGPVLAEALLRLWHRTHERPPAVVVDLGAGRGELAVHVRAALDAVGAAGGAARVVADVVERPDALDSRVEWLRSPGGEMLPDELSDLDDALVVAHEWLDVVPCDIAVVGADGRPRYLLVDPATGAESPDGLLAAADLAWAAARWPTAVPGARIELGLPRDIAWHDLVGRVRSGLVVAVDYGHTAGTRPRGGTLAAYESGRSVTLVPDGSCDITAHVAMDALEADELVTQRMLLRELGLHGRTPEHALAGRDPVAYVRALERASAEAALTRPGGFGDFWWAIRHVGRSATELSRGSR